LTGNVHLGVIPSPEDGVDSKSTFIKRFGDLVALLRLDPGNDAAQELALSAAETAVADTPLEVEAGVEWSAIPEDMSLKSRMLARQVERLRIAAGADASELLSLARALSHDITPVPSSLHVEVELVRLLAPPPPDSPGNGGGHAVAKGPTQENRRRAPERRGSDDRRQSSRGRWRGSERRHRADRRHSGERRLHLIKEQQTEVARLLEALSLAVRVSDSEGALHTVFDLAQLAPRVPLTDRRLFGIQVRRAIPRPLVDGMVDLAERDVLVRSHARSVLRWIGLDAVEIILDRLRQGEALGVRLFYYDVIGGMPEAYPLVTPMLRSPQLHDVRHGAALLGRLGIGAAVEILEPLLNHPDELVRIAVVQSLGELHHGPAADSLRQALRHPSPRTRTAAAAAVTIWRGGALALLLATALESERDRDTWHAMVLSLGRIGSVEACTALAGIALTKRGLLRRSGYSTGQRLAAVAALGLAGSIHGHTTLERLSRESEGVVSYAADRVLQADRLRAG
jgi:HEAT repeats